MSSASSRWRLTLTGVYPGAGTARVHAVELYTSDGANVATSSACAVTATSELSAASAAIDGNATTYWTLSVAALAAAPQYLECDFGAVSHDIVAMGLLMTDTPPAVSAVVSRYDDAAGAWAPRVYVGRLITGAAVQRFGANVGGGMYASALRPITTSRPILGGVMSAGCAPIDVINGGTAQVRVITDRRASPANVPVSRRVTLFRQPGLVPVREAISAPDGALTFSGLSGAYRYAAASVDLSATAEPAAAAMIINIPPEAT